MNSTFTDAGGIPAWAVLSRAESKHLRKSEPVPATRGGRACEHILLRLFRKLREKERLQVMLLANDLALARIRSGLAKDRATGSAARLLKKIERAAITSEEARHG